MTFNPDLARERIRFLECRIEDVDASGVGVIEPYQDEIDWWERQLAEHRND